MQYYFDTIHYRKIGTTLYITYSDFQKEHRLTDESSLTNSIMNVYSPIVNNYVTFIYTHKQYVKDTATETIITNLVFEPNYFTQVMYSDFDWKNVKFKITNFDREVMKVKKINV